MPYEKKIITGVHLDSWDKTIIF